MPFVIAFIFSNTLDLKSKTNILIKKMIENKILLHLQKLLVQTARHLTKTRLVRNRKLMLDGMMGKTKCFFDEC